MILEGRVIMASSLPSHSLNLGGLTEFPRSHSQGLRVTGKESSHLECEESRFSADGRLGFQKDSAALLSKGF